MLELKKELLKTKITSHLQTAPVIALSLMHNLCLTEYNDVCLHGIIINGVL